MGELSVFNTWKTPLLNICYRFSEVIVDFPPKMWCVNSAYKRPVFKTFSYIQFVNRLFTKLGGEYPLLIFPPNFYEGLLVANFRRSIRGGTIQTLFKITVSRKQGLTSCLGGPIIKQPIFFQSLKKTESKAFFMKKGSFNMRPSRKFFPAEKLF